MLQMIIISALAGIVGTGLGGVFGLIFGKRSDLAVSCLLSFAAGVMLSIVFFELIPESYEIIGITRTVLSVLSGVLTVWLLNYAIDYITGNRTMHVSPGELRHQDAFSEAESEKPGAERRRSMLRSGVLMFAAIAIHNLPEGLAIGSGGAHSGEMGIMLAAMIAFHNIPEGISIAVPLIEGGTGRVKAVLLTALSGAPTLLGGLIGYALGGIGAGFVAMALGLAGGAMMYVTFCEILPQATLLSHTRRPAVLAVVGVLFGMILVKVLS